MIALDLFCCDGGAATGLHRAGFDRIVGIDIEPHPNYPFEFIRADATNPPVDLTKFNFIWASPPCQGHSIGTLGWRNTGKQYIDCIPATKALLKDCGIPYCIENVPNAPIKKHLLLCGEMFKLNVIRHRHFEISGFRAEQPRHPHHKKSIDSKKIFGKKYSQYCSVAGHGGDGWSTKLKDWQNAIGIDWISDKKYLAEAVPPAYSEYIAKEFFRTREFYQNRK